MQPLIEIPKPPLPFPFEVSGDETEFDTPRPFKWTKEEYYRLTELGFFEGKRTELIEGEIIEMPTMKTPHATALRKTNFVLNKIFSQTHIVDVQMPIDLGRDSESVPDLAVIEGKIEDFIESHPQTAVLVVEISDTTLSQDRTKKVKLYARHNIAEYWIVNLKHRQLEIYRRPVEEGYKEITVFDESETVSPLANPEAKIAVADLLP